MESGLGSRRGVCERDDDVVGGEGGRGMGLESIPGGVGWRMKGLCSSCEVDGDGTGSYEPERVTLSRFEAERSRKVNVSGREGTVEAGASKSSGSSTALSSTVARVTGSIHGPTPTPSSPSSPSPSPSPSPSASLGDPSPSDADPSSELTTSIFSPLIAVDALSLLLVRLVLSARISPTSDRHIARRIDHSARAMRRNMGVEGGGNLMNDVVGLGFLRRNDRFRRGVGGRLDNRG